MKGADRGRVTDSVLVKSFSAFLYEERKTRTTMKKKTTALLINTAEKYLYTFCPIIWKLPHRGSCGTPSEHKPLQRDLPRQCPLTNRRHSSPFITTTNPHPKKLVESMPLEQINHSLPLVGTTRRLPPPVEASNFLFSQTGATAHDPEQCVAILSTAVQILQNHVHSCRLWRSLLTPCIPICRC